MLYGLVGWTLFLVVIARTGNLRPGLNAAATSAGRRRKRRRKWVDKGIASSHSSGPPLFHLSYAPPLNSSTPVGRQMCPLEGGLPSIGHQRAGTPLNLIPNGYRATFPVTASHS